MTDFNSWQQKVINEILASKNPIIKSVREADFFAYLFFNQSKYNQIVELIKSKEWEKLKLNDDKCATNFKEDLTLVKFINQDNQNCVATIYDSDELWQDPEVIDIFIFN